MATDFMLSVSRAWNRLWGGRPDWTRSQQLGIEFALSGDRMSLEHRAVDAAWVLFKGHTLHCADAATAVIDSLPEQEQRLEARRRLRGLLYTDTNGFHAVRAMGYRTNGDDA